MKNKENAELSEKVERFQVENEEFKTELESLERYKSKWEQSISLLQEADSQSEYIQQQEDEIREQKRKINKYSQDFEDLEELKEEELRSLREEIDGLQHKNIELIKNESLVVMYKKKLEGQKDIKKEKRALELERDSLRGEIEQLKVSKGNNKEQKKIVGFYKTELESNREKVNNFEDAVKAKNNEIVKLKNQYSKIEREMKVEKEKIIGLEEQLAEYLDKTNESVDEYKHRIELLERQVTLLKTNENEDLTKDR